MYQLRGKQLPLQLTQWNKNKQKHISLFSKLAKQTNHSMLIFVVELCWLTECLTGIVPVKTGEWYAYLLAQEKLEIFLSANRLHVIHHRRIQNFFNGGLKDEFIRMCTDCIVVKTQLLR